MIRDSLVKMCTGNIKRWYEYAPYAFWADRVTTRKATGLTPYYAAHGIEPLLPFDITEATFLIAPILMPLSMADLLVVHARMLQKRNEDLAKIHEHVLTARYASTRDFERKNANKVYNYDFKPGELVLVLNKWIEPEIGHKCKPCYFGPMVESIFAKEDFDILPEHRQWDHAIELIPGSEPKLSKIYPLSPVEQKKLDPFLEENLCTRRIRPSKSSMAALVFFIKKKDGSLRLVQDFQVLNSMMVKNKYPLPLISELVSQLRRARYFTKLDIRWGFNNVRIKPRDK